MAKHKLSEAQRRALQLAAAWPAVMDQPDLLKLVGIRQNTAKSLYRLRLLLRRGVRYSRDPWGSETYVTQSGRDALAAEEREG